jgi:hypothetical protein
VRGDARAEDDLVAAAFRGLETASRTIDTGVARGTVADLADAIATKQAPAADGAAALHTLESTVAAYASAALGRTVTVALPATSPLHQSGVIGLRDLDGPDTVPADSPFRRRGLFGLTPTGA